MMYLFEEYDKSLKYILENGIEKKDRTGTGCISVNGLLSRYRLNTEYFPICSKRKVFPLSIFKELLWFLSGSTNNNDLKKQNCNIWSPWANMNDPNYLEFLKKNSFEEGDLGPVYGFQLRHFGANYYDYLTYKKLNISTDELGFDQLKYIINELKNNTYSRRILFSLWNPNDLKLMRLPPCHYTYQVIVDGKDRLSGILTQRSCDFPIGVPSNIQFYSALTIMLAQQIDKEPFEFVHNTIDSHIYLNQIDVVKKYLELPVVDSPKLVIKKAKDIFSYTIEDFVLSEYSPGPKLEIPVSV